MDTLPFPLVVIGLPRRAERRQAIETMLGRVSSDRPVFAADIGAVVDWRQWQPADLDALQTRVFPWCDARSSIGWWNRHLKLGEIACTLSHWNVWTMAAAAEYPGVIVLEDDAVLEPRFADCGGLLTELAHADPAWDLLYLGRARVQPDRGTLARFTLPGFSYCTHGYAVSSRGLRKLLATDLQHAIIPVDEFFCALFLGHPRSDVRARFPPTLAAYGLDEDIVQRQPREVIGSDTETSPFLVPVGA